LLVLWVSRLVKTYSRTSFLKGLNHLWWKLCSFCKFSVNGNVLKDLSWQNWELLKVVKLEKANLVHFVSFPLGGNVLKDIFWQNWGLLKFGTFVYVKSSFWNTLVDKQSFWKIDPENVFQHFFYRFYILHFATSICQDWPFQVPKKSKNILFYKPSEHKKWNFWTIHNQSWQLHCCIIDWSNTIYFQIGALKSSKRPTAFFSTSHVATRNAAFESSNANLGNSNVSSLVDASQSTQIEALKSPKRQKIVLSTSPVGTTNTAFERSTANLGQFECCIIDWSDAFFSQMKLADAIEIHTTYEKGRLKNRYYFHTNIHCVKWRIKNMYQIMDTLCKMKNKEYVRDHGHTLEHLLKNDEPFWHTHCKKQQHGFNTKTVSLNHSTFPPNNKEQLLLAPFK